MITLLTACQWITKALFPVFVTTFRLHIFLGLSNPHTGCGRCRQIDKNFLTWRTHTGSWNVYDTWYLFFSSDFISFSHMLSFCFEFIITYSFHTWGMWCVSAMMYIIPICGLFWPDTYICNPSPPPDWFLLPVLRPRKTLLGMSETENNFVKMNNVGVLKTLVVQMFEVMEC